SRSFCAMSPTDARGGGILLAYLHANEVPKMRAGECRDAGGFRRRRYSQSPISWTLPNPPRGQAVPSASGGRSRLQRRDERSTLQLIGVKLERLVGLRSRRELSERGPVNRGSTYTLGDDARSKALCRVLGGKLLHGFALDVHT